MKRFAVPPGTRDVIISRPMGAIGTLDIDGFSVELVPLGGVAATTNLVVNGDFELGDPRPAGWLPTPEPDASMWSRVRRRLSSWWGRAP